MGWGGRRVINNVCEEREEGMEKEGIGEWGEGR